MIAGCLGALKIKGKAPEAIAKMKVILVGAGSAGIGVAQNLHMAMVAAGAVDTERGVAGRAASIVISYSAGIRACEKAERRAVQPALCEK